MSTQKNIPLKTVKSINRRNLCICIRAFDGGWSFWLDRNPNKTAIDLLILIISLNFCWMEIHFNSQPQVTRITNLVFNQLNLFATFFALSISLHFDPKLTISWTLFLSVVVSSEYVYYSIAFNSYNYMFSQMQCR